MTWSAKWNVKSSHRRCLFTLTVCFVLHTAVGTCQTKMAHWRWHSTCRRLTCWKAAYLERVKDLLAREELLTTSAFSDWEFNCSATAALTESAVMKVNQGDICCLKERLRTRTGRCASFVFVTHGSDQHGSPAGVSDVSFKCFKDILNDRSVIAYYVSQHRSIYEHPKLRLLPIGLGNKAFKIGLSKLEIERVVFASHKSLTSDCKRAVCAINLVEVNINVEGRSSGTHRKRALRSLEAALGKTLDNRYKLDSGSRILERYANAAFVLSPMGTHHDCWRHNEAFIMGAIPIVDQHETFRSTMPGLPFFGVRDWAALTRSQLESHLRKSIQEGLPTVRPLAASFWKNKTVFLLHNSTQCRQKYEPSLSGF